MSELHTEMDGTKSLHWQLQITSSLASHTFDFVRPRTSPLDIIAQGINK